MKKMRVFFLALLIAAMLFTLAGCKKKDKVEQQTQEPAQSVTEVPEEVVEEKEPLKPIDENILMPEANVL